jgi:hypothetical protein
MGDRIHGWSDHNLQDSTHTLLAYFVNLGLGHEEASELHLRYYTQYGLALRGLTRHHDIGMDIGEFRNALKY